MNVIASLAGNLAAMCISDIPFTMNICSDAIFGVLPMIGPAAKFLIEQGTNILTKCFPGVLA